MQFPLLPAVQAAARKPVVATRSATRTERTRGRCLDTPRSSPDAPGPAGAPTPRLKAKNNARRQAVSRHGGAPKDKDRTVSRGHGSGRPRPRLTGRQKSLVGVVGAGGIVGMAACGMAATSDSAPVNAVSHYRAAGAPTTTTTGPPSTVPTSPPITTTAPTSPPPAPVSATTTTPAATVTTVPATSAPTTTTAPVDTGYGCADAIAYLRAHADPAYQIICPADSGPGSEAFTCSNLPGYCVGFQEVIITDPCPAAYMNEASNTWVIDGKSDAPIDPYGSCEDPVGVP
jgi:hypothetical protein